MHFKTIRRRSKSQQEMKPRTRHELNSNHSLVESRARIWKASVLLETPELPAAGNTGTGSFARRSLPMVLMLRHTAAVVRLNYQSLFSASYLWVLGITIICPCNLRASKVSKALVYLIFNWGGSSSEAKDSAVALGNHTRLRETDNGNIFVLAEFSTFEKIKEWKRKKICTFFMLIGTRRNFLYQFLL